MPTKVKTLIADADMDALQLLHDLLEINFRGVKIERAMSHQSFWAKLRPADGEEPWSLIFVSADFVNEEPASFIDRLRAVDHGILSKIIVMGHESDLENFSEDVRELPFLSKPFSLDGFEELVKSVHGS